MEQFLTESTQQHEAHSFILGTIHNINLGLHKQAVHDLWISGEDIDCYCLCKAEIDIDGTWAYLAYQLWINPKIRSLKTVRKIIKFLRFYAQKNGYKRLYVVSSRMDKIKAYARGLGKGFKVGLVTFVNEF